MASAHVSRQGCRSHGAKGQGSSRSARLNTVPSTARPPSSPRVWPAILPADAADAASRRVGGEPAGKPAVPVRRAGLSAAAVPAGLAIRGSASILPSSRPSCLPCSMPRTRPPTQPSSRASFEQAALVEQCTLAHEGRPVCLVVVAQCLELVACGMHPTGPSAIRPMMASSCQCLKRVCTHGVDERDQQGRAVGEQALEDRVVLRIEQRLYPGLFRCAEGVARTACEGDGRRAVAFSRPGARSWWTESRSPRVPTEVGVPRGARRAAGARRRAGSLLPRPRSRGFQPSRMCAGSRTDRCVGSAAGCILQHLSGPLLKARSLALGGL